jgi:hypothetical protein
MRIEWPMETMDEMRLPWIMRRPTIRKMPKICILEGGWLKPLIFT